MTATGTTGTTDQAVQTPFDPAKAAAFGGRIMQILGGGLLSLMVDIGHRTGLFAAASDGWATSDQLAARAGLPGGWLVLGRMAPPPDPVAQAASALRTIRGGGADFAAPRLASALEAAGCASVGALPRTGPAPMEFIVGQRPR
jgi:hypothetical protein